MDEIKVDDMEVNTDLAKEYFEKNNYQFPNDPELRCNESGKDGYNNTIFYTNSVMNLHTELSMEVTEIDRFELKTKLIKLAEEVEKNAEIFSQIEYLVRNIPVNEIQDYDIKLIVQHLSHFRPTSSLHDSCASDIIFMNQNTPLLYLGYVAQSLTIYNGVSIICTENTAAVSQVFVELCHSVGLKSINIMYVNSEKSSTKIFQDFKEIRTGCIGVVTERCDVDSAVDTFLQTTTRYPWKLNRIFVQESVYNSFIEAVTWKANLNPETVPLALIPATKYCRNAFAYGGKTFLFDYAGDAATAGAGILVEAYRTTKELVSFVKSNSAMYLSLWASDISQANEIAYNVPSSIVWINGYGVFDDPPQASQAIYSEIHLANAFSLRCFVTSPESLFRRQEAWANLAIEERLKIVQKETDEFLRIHLSESNDEGMVQFFKNLRSALQNIKCKNFVRVDKDHMCVGISVPIKALLVQVTRLNYSIKADLIADILTIGSAVIYVAEEELTLIKEFFERLATRIPITSSSLVDSSSIVSEDSSSDNKVKNLEVIDTIHSPLIRTKVVWTNFGTKFAN